MGKNKKWMQIAILLAVMIIGGIAIGTSLFKEKTVPRAGSAAPDFKVAGVDGKVHRLSDYEGKYVVLNFWGTYCPPCREEMPDLQKQADKWNGSDIAIIGMNAGENQVTVKSFLDQYGIRFAIFLDETEEIRKSYGVLQYPTTFFIRPDGKIQEIKIGQMDEAFIDRAISAMMRTR